MKRITAALLTLSFLFAGSQTAAAEDGQMLIVNKATNKLAYYDKGELVKVFDVATGADPSLTPEGSFKVIRKEKNVPYYRLGIPGGDPRNPLGPRWLGLNITSDGMTYGIHGNANESSIGTYASAGCVRMHNNEVTWLFDQIQMNTSVTITRSTQGFDELATARGYELTIKNVTPYPTSLMTLDSVNLYTKPNDYYKMPTSIAPQRVYAFEKKENWYHIKTWFGDAWIKAGQNVLVGAVTDLNKTVNLTTTTAMYPYPNGSSKSTGNLAPQSVNVVQEWNGWYRIKTWMGQMWVQAGQ